MLEETYASSSSFIFVYSSLVIVSSPGEHNIQWITRIHSSAMYLLSAWLVCAWAHQSLALVELEESVFMHVCGRV